LQISRREAKPKLLMVATCLRRRLCGSARCEPGFDFINAQTEPRIALSRVRESFALRKNIVERKWIAALKSNHQEDETTGAARKVRDRGLELAIAASGACSAARARPTAATAAKGCTHRLIKLFVLWNRAA
jgi:hypothetical protein